MTAAIAPLEITKPGVYDISNVDYHADPVPGGSLSSTGARKLLPPSCPAIFKWERDNPATPTKAFDLGNAAHDTLLGGGPELVIVPDEITAKDGGWSTKDAKEFVAAARLRGAVPIKPSDMDGVSAMVASIRSHPFAGRLFDVDNGQPEASLFWQDESTKVWRRSRLDWLPARPIGRRFVIPDLKTARSANPDDFAKSAMNYGYHAQAAYYIDSVVDLELDDDPVFVFVVVEKTPPYVVTVVQLDVVALRIGALLNRRAIDTYVECTRTDIWPGYADDIAHVSLPAFYERQYEEELS